MKEAREELVRDRQGKRRERRPRDGKFYRCQRKASRDASF
jgi:hypothetical protein